MHPVAAIIDITHVEIDTVIVWNDGHRNVAYAYENGRVKRTTPLAASTLAAQINEIRATFRVSGGRAAAFGDMFPATTMQTAAVANPGPRRWG